MAEVSDSDDGGEEDSHRMEWTNAPFGSANATSGYNDGEHVIESKHTKHQRMRLEGVFPELHLWCMQHEPNKPPYSWDFEAANAIKTWITTESTIDTESNLGIIPVVKHHLNDYREQHGHKRLLERGLDYWVNAHAQSLFFCIRRNIAHLVKFRWCPVLQSEKDMCDESFNNADEGYEGCVVDMTHNNLNFVIASRSSDGNPITMLDVMSILAYGVEAYENDRLSLYPLCGRETCLCFEHWARCSKGDYKGRMDCPGTVECSVCSGTIQMHCNHGTNATSERCVKVSYRVCHKCVASGAKKGRDADRVHS